MFTGVFWDSLLQPGVETKLGSLHSFQSGFHMFFPPSLMGFLMFSVTFCPDFQRQGPRGWSPVIALKIRRVEIQETHHVNHPFNAYMVQYLHFRILEFPLIRNIRMCTMYSMPSRCTENMWHAIDQHFCRSTTYLHPLLFLEIYSTFDVHQKVSFSIHISYPLVN